jgi:hypothetical protein
MPVGATEEDAVLSLAAARQSGNGSGNESINATKDGVFFCGIVAAQENNHHEFRSGQDNGPKNVSSRENARGMVERR